MVVWLSSSAVVSNGGIGRDLLQAADALDPETLEMLVRLGSELAELQHAKRLQDSAK